MYAGTSIKYNFYFYFQILTVALVDPGKIDIPIVRYAGPLKQRVSSKSKPNKLGESIYMILQHLFLQLIHVSPFFSVSWYLFVVCQYIRTMSDYFQQKGFWPFLWKAKHSKVKVGWYTTFSISFVFYVKKKACKW